MTRHFHRLIGYGDNAVSSRAEGMRKPEKTYRYSGPLTSLDESPEEPEPGCATLERLEHLAAGNAFVAVQAPMQVDPAGIRVRIRPDRCPEFEVHKIPAPSRTRVGKGGCEDSQNVLTVPKPTHLMAASKRGPQPPIDLSQ
jgi:hypothetical protein